MSTMTIAASGPNSHQKRLDSAFELESSRSIMASLASDEKHQTNLASEMMASLEASSSVSHSSASSSSSENDELRESKSFQSIGEDKEELKLLARKGTTTITIVANQLKVSSQADSEQQQQQQQQQQQHQQQHRMQEHSQQVSQRSSHIMGDQMITIDLGNPIETEKKNAQAMDQFSNLREFKNSNSSKSKQHRERGFSASGRDCRFEISWHQLDYVVESNWYSLSSQRKPILDSLSGSIKSGELTAILGPSGAGKSTLIDCLMGKRERGLSGRTRVTFNDPIYEQERRNKRPLRIALIPQADHLLETLTVTETFMFASKIKNAHLTYEEEYDNDGDADTDTDTDAGQDNAAFDQETKSGDAQAVNADNKRELPKQVSRRAAQRIKRRVRKPFDHFANVQRVIKQLDLSSCATLRCGKLSGGQYKRVSIGQELLSRPDLMILDEPTSGLDSVTCYQTISALRHLIDSSPYPMAIVSTIHQPDVEVFELFHKAYVLAAGGRAIYEGPTESIFKHLQDGLDRVELRRKQSSWEQASSADAARNMAKLRHQLEDSPKRQRNPALLIVEVAASKYGFEISSALNELQRQQHSLGNFSSPENGRQSSQSHLTMTSLPPSSPSLSASSPSPSTASTSASVATTMSAQIHNTPPQEAISNSDSHHSPSPPPPKFDYESYEPSNRRAELDKLLCLVAANVNQRRSARVYMKHLVYHTQRSWTTIVRDPMLFSLQVLLHILVPLLISYAFQGQRGDGCPRVGPLDVVHETYRYGNVLDDLNRELRVVIENLGYMFFQIYVIIFAAVCVTSLTYPLAMHVLLKEYRNGWYSMSSYFLGRTLADLPVPTFNVVLAMAISYHLTGQPNSLYAWRFLCVASLTVLATLVAQTQGLMFGAMLMNAPQSAVFVAPASTAPLVVVSGFLIRIQSLPLPLQFLSKFSYFTYLLNGFIVSRYGFNRCPCNEQDFIIEDSHQVPHQARGIINLWVETFAQDFTNTSAVAGALANATTTTTTTTTNEAPQVDLVDKLVTTITRAKTFGFEMNDCSQVKPFTMLDYQLDDSHLMLCFVALIVMLIVCRILTYMVLTWKINSSI